MQRGVTHLLIEIVFAQNALAQYTRLVPYKARAKQLRLYNATQED